MKKLVRMMPDGTVPMYFNLDFAFKLNNRDWKGLQEVFNELAAYEATNHTPEECAAAFKELAAYRAAEQELTVEDIAYAYLQICEKDCAGDCTTGIPPCRFYNPPDVGLFGEPLPCGCELEDYCGYRSEVALKEQEGQK